GFAKLRAQLGRPSCRTGPGVPLAGWKGTRMGRISRTTTAAGLALTMLLGAATFSHAHTYHALRLSNILLAPSVKGAYFGAYLPPKQWTQQGQMDAITSVESSLGRKLDIVNIYYP